jgi:signal transduction histidine kinase
VWVPPGSGSPAGALLFPRVSVVSPDDQIAQSRCTAEFKALSGQPDASVDALARSLVVGCRSESPTVRLWAATHAAQLLMADRRYKDALVALSQADVPESLTLRAASAQGIDPFRVVAWRTLAMQDLLRLNRTEVALDLGVRLGDQIADMDAPDLSAIRDHLRRIVESLTQNGRMVDAARFAEIEARLDRRVHAYGEVERRLSGEPPPAPNADSGRFVYDVYSDQPFLLYYGWSNGYGAALALEQDPLIDDFLATRMHNLARYVSVTEARSDRWVAGARGGGRCAIEVPFTSTLTNLRVCVRQAMVDTATASVSDQWYVPLFLLVGCVVVGIGGLYMVDRATLHEVELLSRQRAFSTRVTHELKTPLAGIKVMAENLEAGAFRDEAHRRDMAHRIVAEADNLTRRVDEVLNAARQRTIPKPEPVDPEEVLFQVVDDWGPRLHDAGVTLHAEDLEATDPVLGDPNALRDAVACLLDNALKYRKDGRPDSAVWLSLAQNGRSVEITVTDNGIGVPKAMRKKVFDRFVRVEGPHRGKAGGHGLGLHQVREIVTAHRGTVTCEDGIDGGAEFTIRLPALRKNRA